MASPNELRLDIENTKTEATISASASTLLSRGYWKAFSVFCWKNYITE
jgi:hypothetical protein